MEWRDAFGGLGSVLGQTGETFHHPLGHGVFLGPPLDHLPDDGAHNPGYLRDLKTDGDSVKKFHVSVQQIIASTSDTRKQGNK